MAIGPYKPLILPILFVLILALLALRTRRVISWFCDAEEIRVKTRQALGIGLALVVLAPALGVHQVFASRDYCEFRSWEHHLFKVLEYSIYFFWLFGSLLLPMALVGKMSAPYLALVLSRRRDSISRETYNESFSRFIAVAGILGLAFVFFPFFVPPFCVVISVFAIAVARDIGGSDNSFEAYLWGYNPDGQSRARPPAESVLVLPLVKSSLRSTLSFHKNPKRKTVNWRRRYAVWLSTALLLYWLPFMLSALVSGIVLAALLRFRELHFAKISGPLRVASPEVSMPRAEFSIAHELMKLSPSFSIERLRRYVADRVNSTAPAEAPSEVDSENDQSEVSTSNFTPQLKVCADAIEFKNFQIESDCLRIFIEVKFFAMTREEPAQEIPRVFVLESSRSCDVSALDNWSVIQGSSLSNSERVGEAPVRAIAASSGNGVSLASASSSGSPQTSLPAVPGADSPPSSASDLFSDDVRYQLTGLVNTVLAVRDPIELDELRSQLSEHLMARFKALLSKAAAQCSHLSAPSLRLERLAFVAGQQNQEI